MTLQNWNNISFFPLETGNPRLTLDLTVRNLPGAASIIMNKNINMFAVSIKGTSPGAKLSALKFFTSMF